MKTASVEGITEYGLSNGLKVLFFPDGSQSKVTVNMTVLVGSRHEGYGETGMAHLLEHLVFKGTPKHPLVPKALQDHGAQFNGSTSSDRTNYFETLAASDENLRFALELEADRLMNSSIKGEDLESEMTVVRNEFERGENSPSSVLMKRIESVAYDWHNYGKPTIGNRSDIERVPVESLRAFYRKYYHPDNVVLVVAGRFDQDRALALVEEHFGAIPRPQRKLPATYTEEPAQDGERLVTLRRVGDVGAVGVAYHVPAGPHPELAALQVLANVLSTQPSGRLYKALIETRKAARASAYASGEHDPGLMTIQAEVTRDGSLDEVRDLIIGTVEEIGAKGVTVEEVNRARQQILKQRELAATDTSQIAISLSEWAAQGDWRLYFLHRDQIEQVTPEAVKAAASRYLQRNNRTVGLYLPTEKAERAVIPPTPEVAALVADYHGRAPLAEGEAFEATPANVEARVQRLELPEHIKVALLAKKTRGEEARLSLTLRYGNQEDLKGLESVVGFLPELMLRGTRKLGYQEIRDELDRLKAQLSAGGGGGGRGGRSRGGSPTTPPGALSFSIQAKRETLPAVLEILRQVLREPTLPADQFEVLKRERLAAVEQARTEPSALAPRLLQRELNSYPNDDIRYVPTIDESLERLRSVTREQVVQLYRDQLGSQEGELTIVGDFDAGRCLSILKEMLSGWTPPKRYARIPMPIAGPEAGSEHKISTPDKANATYTAGLLFPIKDDHADYPALVLGNYILGSGALSSRLGNRVRQKEGLSYGISSSFSASSFDERAGLTITAICNPENAPRVEKAVREELERLLKDGITAEELDQARQGYLEAQKVGRSSDGALANILSGLSHAGRTMAFQAELEGKIAGLTPDQVLAALRRHLDLKRLVIVTAGDFGTKTASARR